MQRMNCRDLIERVRYRLHDVDSHVYQDLEVLQTADDQLRKIYARMRSAGEAYFLDSMDLDVSQFTALTASSYEYELPDYVYDVQKLEGMNGSAVVLEIPRATLEDSNILTGYRSRGAVWMFSNGGYSGTLRINGSVVGSASAIRIWFVRAIGPLTYGTASAGTTLSITLATATGDHRNRVDIYKGMHLEVTADSGGAANVGQVRRVTGYTGGVFSLNQALPAAASSTTQWAMIPPVPPEHLDYLTQLVTVSLLARSTSAEQYQLQQDELFRLERSFEAHINNRQTGEPKRVTSSRSRR